jgi:drug/metabolite transporter (DMT)-like permease
MARHIALILFLALVWSASFMAMKIGVDTIPPLTLTAGRVLIAAIILYIIASLLGYQLPTEVRFWRYCLVLGVLGNGLPFTLISWGEEQVNSGQAAILMAVMPMVTIVLAHFFSVGDRMTLAKVTSVIFGFSGVIILVGPEALKGIGGDFWHQLAISGGAVCYALTVIIIRNMPEFPLITRSAGVLIASSFIMVPIALIVDVSWKLAPSLEGLLAMIYLGVFPTALATVALLYLIQKRGANFVAYANYLIPIFAVFWGSIFLNEILSSQAGIALVVILSGLALTQIRRRN